MFDSDIGENEIIVDLNNLTPLQQEFYQHIIVQAQADGACAYPTAQQKLAAAEKCAEQSYGARCPAGPSGAMAAVYRAIGRAIVGRPVQVDDASKAPQWRRVGNADVLDLDLFFLSAGESGEWSVETRTSHAVRTLSSGTAASMRSARLAAIDAGLALLARHGEQLQGAPHDK